MALPEKSSFLPKELEENWMRYEYFKRTCLTEARRNMRAMMDSEWLEEAVDTWINDNQKPGTSQESEEGSNARKRKHEFDQNAEIPKQQKKESTESPEVSPVENLAQSSESNKVETKKNDDDGTEGSHGPINSEDSLAQSSESVCNLYNKFGEERLQSLKRNPLKCEDLPEILFIHRHCVDQKDDIYSLLLPIKKIKVTIDYGKVKIEVYIDSNSNQCSRIEYWSYEDLCEDGESTEHCLIWNEDSVRKVSKRKSSVLSAEAFAILVKNPETKFDELDFDIFPFFQGLPEIYPEMSFYTNASYFLDKFACKQISTIRFTCTLFAGPYDDDIENNAFIDGIWNLIHPEVLEYIKFRNWFYNTHLPDGDDQSYLWPSDRLKGDRYKNARYLDIQNFGFLDDWHMYSTFSRIGMAQLNDEQILQIVCLFQSGGPVTIRTRCRIDVEGVKAYLTHNLVLPYRLNFAGNAFTLNDEPATVVAELEDYQLCVTVTGRDHLDLQ